MLNLLLLLILSQTLVGPAAADRLRERQIGEQVESKVRVGEAVTLKTGEVEFLAIHAKALTRQTQGGVILLHDRGANPDWRAVIHPLRSALPAHGWETLSIQLPVASVDAADDRYDELMPKAFPRLDFAVDFFSQRQLMNIVVIGHGQGGRTLLQWLAKAIPEPVRAGVAIGLTATEPDIEPGTLNSLGRIKLPLLDLYGSRDRSEVVDTAPKRAAAAREADNSDYRQLRIEGADHDFRGLDALLVSRVRAWMARVAPGREKQL